MSAPRSREPIVAIATASGRGAIGIVRLSGQGLAALATALCGRDLEPRHATLVSFLDRQGATIDRGLAIHFPAPHSYTGEDVLELQTHGSPIVLKLLLARLVELGARHARPGEFSERAFLNGKLDLAQAEAVADLIASGSEAAARAALRSLDGEFSRRVRALNASVVRLRVWVEAAIDFPEEEIDFLSAPELRTDLASVRTDLSKLLDGARRGVRLADGLHVVIVGRPNAGKSSLLNALAASERAIVTEIPGTTRDLVRETVDVDGVSLTLVDTAGLRESADVVEREGIRRARAELERADVVLLVADVAEDPDAALAIVGDVPPSVTRLVVRNKIDVAGIEPRRERRDGYVEIRLSAKTGAGLDLLHAELRKLAGGETNDGGWTARTRHVTALERARTHLAAAESALVERNAGELAAEELREVQHALGEITGEFTSEDLLGEIFGSFCIGK